MGSVSVNSAVKQDSTLPAEKLYSGSFAEAMYRVAMDASRHVAKMRRVFLPEPGHIPLNPKP